MKLNETQVIEIFLSEETTALLAAIYGVSTFTIRAIKRGHTRGDITGQLSFLPVQPKSRRPILSDEMVKGIFRYTGSLKTLKSLYGVSKSVANNIKFRHTYQSITEGLGDPGELRIHSLTWDDVCTIRASSLQSSVLADLFFVSPATINNIRAGRTRQFK